MDTRGVLRDTPTEFTIVESMSTDKERPAAYTVEIMAAGLAAYLEVSQVNYKDRGVIIAYDGGELSFHYAQTTAAILGSKGIKTTIFSKNQPAVLLSYSIRHFGAAGGLHLVEHGGQAGKSYRMTIYNESGSRLTDEASSELEQCLERVDRTAIYTTQTLHGLEEQPVPMWIQDEVSNAYLDRLDRLSDKILLQDGHKDLSIAILTEDLASLNLLTKALKRHHFQHVTHHAEKSTGQLPETEIILETDGRGLSVYAKNNDKNKQALLSDQALELLLTDYILSQSDKNLHHNARIIRTTKSSPVRSCEAVSREIEWLETAPGFHHISEKVREFDWTGETFLFGYDGAGGYLIDEFVRVEDAIQTAVVVCEMAQHYKNKNKSLLEVSEMLAGSF